MQSKFEIIILVIEYVSFFYIFCFYNFLLSL